MANLGRALRTIEVLSVDDSTSDAKHEVAQRAERRTEKTEALSLTE